MQTPFEKLKTDWLSERYGIRLIAARNYDGAPEEALGLVVQYDEEPPRRKYLYERRLRDLNDRYPEMPELYARLYDLYLEIGKAKYADQIVRRMMKKLPEGYRTVIYRLLNENSREGQKGLRSSLGPEAEITHFPPDEAAGYDYYGFINFEHAVVHHFAVTGDVYRAKKRLERLIALGLEDEDLRPYAENIMEHESVGLWGSRKWYATYEIKVAATEPVRLPYAWEEPPLRLPESKIFIDPEAENLTPEIAKELLVLPREDLIADLYTIVRDPIVRREVILETINWWRAEHVMTAFVLLWELGETAALTDLLNLIRMDDEWQEAFFGSEISEYLPVPLLLFGKGQLSALAEFCLEPNVEGYGRSAVVATLAQVALHDSSQEEAVVGHFERIFLALLEAETTDGLIDTVFVTNATLAYGHLRDDRLLPLLKRLEDRHWIDPSVFGGLYDLEFELGQARDPLDVTALPDNLLDYLDGGYKDRHRQRALSSSGRIPFGQRPKAVVTAYLRKVNLSRYAAPAVAKPKPVSQPGKKVGRNAPCPCGSGRKFKRCCGKG